MSPKARKPAASRPAPAKDRSDADGLSLRSLVAVGKKEFLDNVRSYWIIGITIVFIVLSLVISYFGAAQSGGGTGFQDPRATASGMMSLSTILVPIIALMLGYGTVVTEREDGSLPLLLSMPITRLETMLGKFVGLGGVVAVAIVAGLGLGGLIIVGAAGGDGAGEYAGLMLGTILLGLAFLSIGMFLSTLSRSRGMALGLAVVAWFFFAIIFQVILIGVLFATGNGPDIGPGGGNQTGGGAPTVATTPDWYFAAQLVNPASAYGLFGNSVLGLTQGSAFTAAYPGFVNAWSAGGAILLWVAVPLLVSIWRLEKQDL